MTDCVGRDVAHSSSALNKTRMRRLNKWIDARWRLGDDQLLNFLAFCPTIAAIFVSRDLWWVGAIFTVALLSFFWWRGYRVGRRFLRPIDQARDDWASIHQSKEYRKTKKRHD